MSLIYRILKYLRRWNNQSENFSLYSYVEQKKILDSIKQPQNMLERSYFQYLCQIKTRPMNYRVFKNLFAAFLVPYYLIKPYKEPTKVDVMKNQNNAVFLREGITLETMPNSLKSEFEFIYEKTLIGEVFLSKNDKKFICKIIKRYFYKPLFALKCMLKIGMYSSVMKKYRPNAIVTHNEYSYASSVLTEYCRLTGVEHINIMHGEKLFDITDAFATFDRFYVWDQHYVDLLVQLRAEKEQFRIEIPISVKLDISNIDKYKYELTYYLGGESENDLAYLKLNLINTKIPIERICLRYHPRYGDKQKINSIFAGFQMENPNEVPLNVSISQTRYVVSLYSTVLYQAYKSGKEIIIDDVTEPRKYEKLKSLKYIMMDKPHLLLSEVISLAD